MSSFKLVAVATILAAALNGCASQHQGHSTSPAAAVLDQHDSASGHVEQTPQVTSPIATPRQGDLRGHPSDWPLPVHDNQAFTFLRAEQLEYRARDGAPDVARWEAQGWHGRDYEKLWFKTEGEQSVEGGSEGELELQALYSRLVSPFWNFQVGARYDTQWGTGPDSDRWLGVVGVQGFSRYEFEVEAALFVSEEADVSARLTASTDILFTQRLILQPRFETELSFSNVPEFQVGEGLNYVDLGLRLRYELKREFAPYLGANWIQSLGQTEDFLTTAGGESNDLALVMGLSLWF